MNENLLREWIRKVLLESTDEEREEIERAMADYQSAGGEIERLPPDPNLSGEDQVQPAGDCATNPLFTGTFLGYAGEWAVFHAAQGASQPSGTPWGDSLSLIHISEPTRPY